MVGARPQTPSDTAVCMQAIRQEVGILTQTGSRFLRPCTRVPTCQSPPLSFLLPFRQTAYVGASARSQFVVADLTAPLFMRALHTSKKTVLHKILLPRQLQTYLKVFSEGVQKVLCFMKMLQIIGEYILCILCPRREG
jgi:hypothetical protein